MARCWERWRYSLLLYAVDVRIRVLVYQVDAMHKVPLRDVVGLKSRIWCREW